MGTILTGVVIALLGFIGGRLYETMKKIQFKGSDWLLFYGVRDELNDNDIDYILGPTSLPVVNIKFAFRANFFSEKTNPIGIHQFCVQFVRGPKQSEMIVEEHSVLMCDESYTPLKTLTLKPHEWVEQQVVGYLTGDSPAQKADSVQLIVLDASGKKFGPWHVANLKRWPPMVEQAPR